DSKVILWVFCRGIAQTIAIEPQQLDQIPALTAKHEHMPVERVLLQRRLHHRAQAHKTASQVREAGHNPDMCVGRNHARSSFSTVRSSPTSALPSMRICAPASLM